MNLLTINLFPLAVIALFSLAAIAEVVGGGSIAKAAFYALSAAINACVMFMK